MAAQNPELLWLYQDDSAPPRKGGQFSSYARSHVSRMTIQRKRDRDQARGAKKEARRLTFVRKTTTLAPSAPDSRTAQNSETTGTGSFNLDQHECSNTRPIPPQVSWDGKRLNRSCLEREADASRTPVLKMNEKYFQSSCASTLLYRSALLPLPYQRSGNYGTSADVGSADLDEPSQRRPNILRSGSLEFLPVAVLGEKSYGLPSAILPSPAFSDCSTDSEVPEFRFVKQQPSESLMSRFNFLSLDEQSDLFQFLLGMSSGSFGSKPRALFCPGRDIALHTVQEHRETLQWMLMEVDYCASRHNPSVILRLHRRRARAYRQIQKLLSDPATQATNDTLAVVMGATCIEHRTQQEVGRNLVRAHYKGLASLVDKRGGLWSLFGFTGCGGHPMFYVGHLHFAELEISDFEEIDQCSQSFFFTLSQIQKSKLKQQMQSNRIPEETPTATASPLSKSTLRLKEYLAVFHTTTRAEENVSQLLSYFITLYWLSLIVYSYGAQVHVASAFLQRFLRLLEESFPADPNTGHLTLRLDVLSLYIAKAWIDTDESSQYEGGGPTQEVWLTGKAIDALKTFGRLSDRSKLRILIALESWLDPPLQPSENQKSNLTPKYLNETELQNMMAEARSDWYERYVK